MSESPRELEEVLSDPDRYVRVPERVIFDEHDEEYHVDGEGRPCSASKKGARKKVRRFTRERLEEIARRCNRRDATGSLTPLTLGHTDPDEKDETKQPEGAGYVRNFSVAYSPRLGRHVLQADFYVKKDRYEQATTFPRVSVELWERHGIIDPVALLRRTPARDLGQWTYGRAGSVLRYSREFSMNDEQDLDLPEGPDSAPDAAPEPSHEEKADQVLRHLCSHPHMRYMMGHYAMPEDEPMADDQPMADPTDAPDAAEPAGEEPLMNNLAVAGPTNGKVPAKPSQFSRDVGRIHVGRAEKELAELRRQVAELRQERDLEAGRRLVTQLAAEGYEMDADEEALAFSKLDEAGRQKRADHVRRFYRQAPLGSGRPVPLAPNPSRRKPAEGEPADDGHFQRALHYVREHGGDFESALRQTRAK